jgi:predicted Zn-dependent protease
VVEVIDRRDLAHALERRGVADWVIIDRNQELGVFDERAPRLRRVEHRTRWQLTVHVDMPNGRGSAHVELDLGEGSVDAIVDQTIKLARATVGPAWRSTPTAAPARVALIDDELARAEPVEIAEGLLHAAKRPDGATVVARATCLRERVTAVAHGGLHTTWSAALLHVDALVTVGEHGLQIARDARRPRELALDAALAAAARDAGDLATAAAPTPGACALLVGEDALLEGGLGLWQAFAYQADALVERQGLTRYRERAPIVPGADQLAEPLTIASDGALDHGVYSTPLGDEGDAVRRFPLVERGIAAGLGLSPREAALRGRDPNGGVRNLVVALGSWTGEMPTTTGRVVEIRRLRDLAIDRYTGDARLELALAFDRGKPFTGGTIRLDLIDALARARRSAARVRRGAYEGPAAVWIDSAELIA